MALPKQMRAQVAEANAIEQQMRDDKESKANKKAEEIDGFINELNLPEDGEQKPELKAVENTPAPEPKPEEAVATPEKKERKDYKHMYSVLQGKYNAEVPQLHERIKDLQTQVTSLTAAVAKPAAAEQNVTATTPVKELVSAEEREEYGDDLLDVVGRRAKEILEAEYRPQIEAQAQEIQRLQGQIGATGKAVEAQEQNQVFAQLDRDVKDWRTTNEDPAFKEWLGGVDPYAGRTRQAMLMEAFTARDVPRVKMFFDGFNQENAAVSNQGATANGAPKATLNLEEFVTPNSGGNTQAGAPQQKRVWTQPEIQKFYSDVQKGYYKNREADRAKIDREIGVAAAEGRVR